MADNNPDIIDEAIGRCVSTIESHRKVANRIILYLGIAVFCFILSLIAVGSLNQNSEGKFKTLVSRIDSAKKDISSIDDTLNMHVKKLGDVLTAWQINIDRVKYLNPSYQGIKTIDSFVTVMNFIDLNLKSAARQQNRVLYDMEYSKSKFEEGIVPIDKTILFIYYGVLIFIIGLLTSFYRFHLKEISKYEHFLFAFERIRIAGSNYQNGFADIVRDALAKEAFIIKEEKITTKKSKIESPIPGHIGSDMATFLLNKIFENIDLRATPKANSSGSDQTS